MPPPCKPDSVHSRRNWTAISLPACAGLRLRGGRLIPGDSERAGDPSPVLSCTTWGLPCPGGYPTGRWALTPPFHPYLIPCGPSAVCSLLHFPSGSLDAAVPLFREARCPAVSGLSSTLQARPRSPGERRGEAALGSSKIQVRSSENPGGRRPQGGGDFRSNTTVSLASSERSLGASDLSSGTTLPRTA